MEHASYLLFQLHVHTAAEASCEDMCVQQLVCQFSQYNSSPLTARISLQPYSAVRYTLFFHTLCTHVCQQLHLLAYIQCLQVEEKKKVSQTLPSYSIYYSLQSLIYIFFSFLFHYNVI